LAESGLRNGTDRDGLVYRDAYGQHRGIST
jgi:hypothetical protein